MAKTRPNGKSKSRQKSSLNRAQGPASTKALSIPKPSVLLAQAAEKLQQTDVPAAATLAKRALAQIDDRNIEHDLLLPAIILLGEIHVELGEIDDARNYFLRAVELDPQGTLDEADGGGPEKFLWLAQLSDEGGKDSVNWFEKGAAVLRAQLQLLDKAPASPERDLLIEDKRRKLATALCSVAEVYMTDLSWEADAEAMCESLVTEATMVAADAPEPLQTLASVRISQSRREDAQAALRRSMDLWKDLPPEDDRVPEFPTRVSLARLLMEVEMEEEAIEVLERLVLEEDQSVEVWYLGGWGLYILGEKLANGEIKGDGEDAHKVTWFSSRQWLNQSLKLFAAQEYEDDRLREHALELVAKLDAELGGPAEGGEEEWEEYEGSGGEDEEMDEA